MDTVYGFAGHSIVPTLALIHSKIAHRYVFMFTEELSENKLMFERYLKQKIWEDDEPEIVLYTIGAVGDFSNTFQKIKEIIDTNQEYALFLQNGAKQAPSCDDPTTSKCSQDISTGAFEFGDLFITSITA